MGLVAMPEQLEVQGQVAIPDPPPPPPPVVEQVPVQPDIQIKMGGISAFHDTDKPLEDL
jgi:hypothetical protein